MSGWTVVIPFVLGFILGALIAYGYTMTLFRVLEITTGDVTLDGAFAESFNEAFRQRRFHLLRKGVSSHIVDEMMRKELNELRTSINGGIDTILGVTEDGKPKIF